MIILHRYKVNNINRFKRFIFISVLFSILVFAPIATLKAYSKDIPRFDYINVTEGDTLWSIASCYTTDDKEIREVIHKVSELNNIHNSLIYPGDIIKIPLN